MEFTLTSPLSQTYTSLIERPIRLCLTRSATRNCLRTLYSVTLLIVQHWTRRSFILRVDSSACWESTVSLTVRFYMSIWLKNWTPSQGVVVLAELYEACWSMCVGGHGSSTPWPTKEQNYLSGRLWIHWTVTLRYLAIRSLFGRIFGITVKILHLMITY